MKVLRNKRKWVSTSKYSRNLFIMRTLLTLSLISLLFSCTMSTNEINSASPKYTNELINETSPYLLQHAHNPVNWLPWGEAALKKASDENKPLLISIGYSACHWCHVMEKESFEDSAVAAFMNENFICIKVDREERPDIDQVYMNAVQIMTGRGGWPLNCIATPDGRPFYGGTYFPKKEWMEVLDKIITVFKTEPGKVEEYASKIVEGVKSSELIASPENNTDSFSLKSFAEGLKKWQSVFDSEYGGNQQAPKFPIPNNYLFLLNYAHLNNDTAILKHVNLTLKKMTFGGIYDQVGGGFARYSTDLEWKVPHFEKMLYDNAQLISLYSKAFQKTKDPLYKKIVEESIQFVNESLSNGKGIYYSALDADTEGEEGKFYVWTKEELKTLLKDDFKFAESYFNINSFGLWEHGNYILIRKEENAAIAKSLNVSEKEFEAKIGAIKKILKQEREQRTAPGVDDKSLTSWNALMISALVDAYFSLGNETYLNQAIETADFILKNQSKKDGGLWHNYKDGKSTINGYLEDYCFSIEAFIQLYEATFNQKWLEIAKDWSNYSIKNFYDQENKLFYFTSHEDPALFSRNKEILDNVIPSSNSSMARALFRLGKLFPEEKYDSISRDMLLQIQNQFNAYLPSYSNWALLLLERIGPFYEVAIAGKAAKKQTLELQKTYIPNKIILGMTANNADLELLEDKWVVDQTTIYVCENKVCLYPVTTSEEAIKLLLD